MPKLLQRLFHVGAMSYSLKPLVVMFQRKVGGSSLMWTRTEASCLDQGMKADRGAAT
jgi:hypothetical protein